MPIRIGVNGGSLDPALYEKHGGRVTAEAMVESAQQELAYFDEVGFDDIKISVKASNVPLMIDAYRLLADTVDYPLHLGVTEAGPPPAGPGEGHRRHGHPAGRGHRRHHPLLAHRRPGRGGPRRAPAAREPGPARAQGPRPHRLPVVRPGRGRRHRGGEQGPGGPRRHEHPHPGGGHGLRGERPGRGPRGRPRHRRRPQAGPPVREGRGREGRARGRDGRRPRRVGRDHRRGRGRGGAAAQGRLGGGRRPRPTAPPSSTSRATTPTTPPSTSS